MDASAPQRIHSDLADYLPRILRADGEFRRPAGDGATAWVDTPDIAATAAVVLTESGHEAQAYAVTGPQSLTMTEVASIASAAWRRPVRYVDATPRDTRAHLTGRRPRDLGSFLREHPRP